MSFEAWIGREVRASDRLDETLAARWHATFDRADSHPPLMPQGIHFCLCTPDAATMQLGEDGHPQRDDSADSFLPPIPLPRRMWAASAIEFHKPLMLGATIERVSRVASIKEKDGASGKLAFLEAAHQTSADGVLAITETQTLVYREAAAPDAPLSPPPLGESRFEADEWEHHRTTTADPRLLFRYSALTFNTHRIHYDAPYARDVERYRGLVVHGPLTASLLLQLAATHLGENRLTRFAFRGKSPAIAGEALHLVMRGGSEKDSYELSAFAPDGRHVMEASATA